MNAITMRGKRTLIYRAGAVGFWFFLIKGLLWLAAPLVLCGSSKRRQSTRNWLTFTLTCKNRMPRIDLSAKCDDVICFTAFSGR